MSGAAHDHADVCIAIDRSGEGVRRRLDRPRCGRNVRSRLKDVVYG